VLDVDRLPVAVDAMGGDRAPGVVVEGAIAACAAGDGPVVLVGDEAAIRAELQGHGAGDLPIEIVHAPEVIAMAEHPGRAARAKRDSSMHVGFRLVRERRACGFVSAGNSGAMMAVGLLTLRRVPRCDRPAIAGVLPTRGAPTVLVDMGANVECRAVHLVQFALMGAAYSQVRFGNERPSVALLSNGSEPTKGTETLREAHRLLTTTDLRYLGYIEGRDLPLGRADVVVTDGFVGNITLKLSEGIAVALAEKLRDGVQRDWRGAVGAWFLKRTLRSLRDELDPGRVGAAPLLGLEGVGMVAHGGSDARAIASAIRSTRECARLRLVEHLRTVLEASDAPAEGLATAELPITRSDDGAG
jgi:glycerol-3-phosphate acyltransferase PlsX